jgi:hypothetical protein
MTNEEILNQQVEALEKLLKLKQAIVEELEDRVAKLENEKNHYVPYNPNPLYPGITIGPGTVPGWQPFYGAGGVPGGGIVGGSTIKIDGSCSTSPITDISNNPVVGNVFTLTGSSRNK